MDPAEPEQPSTSRDTVGSTKRRFRSLPQKKSKGDEGKFVLYLPGSLTRLLNESGRKLSSPSSVSRSPIQRNLNSSPRRSSPREQPARATVIVSPARNRNLSPSAAASPMTSPSSMLKQLHLTKSTTMSPPSNSMIFPSSSSAIRTNGTCTPPKKNFNSLPPAASSTTSPSSMLKQLHLTKSTMMSPPSSSMTSPSSSSSAIRMNGTPPKQNFNSLPPAASSTTSPSSSSAIRTNGICTPPKQNFNSLPPVASSTISPSSSSTWVRTKGTWTPPRENLNSSPSVSSSMPSPSSSSQDPETSPILRLLLTTDTKVSPSKYWKLKQQLAKNLNSSESAVSSTTSPLITMEQLAIGLRIITPPRTPSRSARSSRLGQNWRSAAKKKNSLIGKPTKKRGTCPKCHWIWTLCQCSGGNKKERN